MERFTAQRLAQLESELSRCDGVDAMMRAVADATCAVTGLGTAFMALYIPRDAYLQLLDAVGSHREAMWEAGKMMPVEGDALLERLVDRCEPVFTDDAQAEPSVNREIVATLEIRTLVLAPMCIDLRLVACIGAASFGQEGVSPVSSDRIHAMTRIASLAEKGLARLQLDEAYRALVNERQEIALSLARRQRLEAMGEIAAGVAHDFRNILTAVMSSVDFLLESELDEAQREELRMVEEALERAAELSGRLLALGKGHKLEKRTVDLGERLVDLLKLVRRILSPEVTIEYREPPQLPSIHADAQLLEQVFLNLCLNARDAMPSGGKLTITSDLVHATAEHQARAPRLRPGELYVRVSFVDTGTGMSPAVLTRIFEPFFTTKESVGGTGLGLAVSRSIMEDHEGALLASSTPGQGTTVEVLLPVRTEAQNPPREEDLLAPTGPRGVVLVVEPDALVLSALGRVLERAGLRVVPCGDGQTAVERLRCERFDLVLLEAALPVVGAPELLRRISEIVPESATVVLSHLPRDQVILALGGAEVDTILTKPFDGKSLIAAVTRALAGR